MKRRMPVAVLLALLGATVSSGSLADEPLPADPAGDARSPAGGEETRSLVAAAPAEEQDGLLAAERLVEAADYAGALTVLAPWLAAHPDDAAARFLEARLLGWTEDYAGALEVYETLLDREPTNADYLLGKGQVLLWMGRPGDAQAVLERARQLAPDYEELWRLELNARIARAGSVPDPELVAFADAAQARFPDAAWARYEPLSSRARLGGS